LSSGNYTSSDYSNGVTATTIAPATGNSYTFDTSQNSNGWIYNLIDAANPAGGRDRSAFCVLPINTDCTTARIKIETWSSETYEPNVYVMVGNDTVAVAQTTKFPATGGNWVPTSNVQTITVPVGSGARHLDFRAGPAAYIKGKYVHYTILEVALSGGTYANIATVARKARRRGIFSDSIYSNVGKLDSSQGFIPGLRLLYPDDEVVSAAAVGMIGSTRYPDTASQAAFAQACKAYSLTDLHDGNITNEWGFSIPVAQFIGVKTGLWDQLRAAIPALRITTQTAFARGDDNQPNGLGLYLHPAYSQAVSDAVAAHTDVTLLPDARYVIGVPLINYVDLVHPNLGQGTQNILNWFVSATDGSAVLPTAGTPTGKLNATTSPRTYVVTSGYPLSELLLSTNGGAFTAASSFTLNLPDTAVDANYYRFRIAATSAHQQSGILSFPGIAARAAGVPTFTANSPNPSSGPVGTTVTTQGTGLFGATALYPGGVFGEAVENSSDEQHISKVPAGATGTGPITYTNQNGSTQSPPFTVTVASGPKTFNTNTEFDQPAVTDATQGWTTGSSVTVSGNGVAQFTNANSNDGTSGDLLTIPHNLPAGTLAVIRIQVTEFSSTGRIDLLTGSGNWINSQNLITSASYAAQNGYFEVSGYTVHNNEPFVLRAEGGVTAKMTYARLTDS
jgi:hypothetical protein